MHRRRAWKKPDSLILETRVREDCSTDPCWSLQALIHSKLRLDSTSFSAMCGSVARVSQTDLKAAWKESGHDITCTILCEIWKGGAISTGTQGGELYFIAVFTQNGANLGTNVKIKKEI